MTTIWGILLQESYIRAGVWCDQKLIVDTDEYIVSRPTTINHALIRGLATAFLISDVGLFSLLDGETGVDRNLSQLTTRISHLA